MERSIHNHKQMGQCVDFSGLEIGRMNATDVDCCMEYKDKLFIYVETKYDDAEIPIGQRLFLERQVDAVSKAGKVGIAIKTKHFTSDDIDIANTTVTKIYWEGKWIVLTDGDTLLAMRNRLLREYVPEVAVLLS